MKRSLNIILCAAIVCAVTASARAGNDAQAKCGAGSVQVCAPVWIANDGFNVPLFLPVGSAQQPAYPAAQAVWGAQPAYSQPAYSQPAYSQPAYADTAAYAWAATSAPAYPAAPAWGYTPAQSWNYPATVSVTLPPAYDPFWPSAPAQVNVSVPTSPAPWWMPPAQVDIQVSDQPFGGYPSATVVSVNVPNR